MAILTFWKIVLEILDTISKQSVFCWISDFTELKAFRLFILFSGIFEAIELDMDQTVFINMLVHKNGNSTDTVLWSSSFADFLFL